jgi:hypothetical protein
MRYLADHVSNLVRHSLALLLSCATAPGSILFYFVTEAEATQLQEA